MTRNQQPAERGDFDSGFNQGILNALALMVAHGDGCGTMYVELLNLAGADKVIAYARKESAMRWAGLDKYIRFLKENAQYEESP